MIVIECDKCGAQSDNTHRFRTKSFSYIDHENRLHSKMHLCQSCQNALRKAIDSAIAEFLGVPSVRDFDWHDGIG